MHMVVKTSSSFYNLSAKMKAPHRSPILLNLKPHGCKLQDELA